MTESVVPWKCPKCGAEPYEHGLGGKASCEGRGKSSSVCLGFLCLCDAGADEECGTVDNPCENAVCYHCGWSGVFPKPPIDPSKLKGWKRTAWNHGWRPTT